MGVQYHLCNTEAEMQAWHAETLLGLNQLRARITFDSGNRHVVVVTPLGQPGHKTGVLLDPWPITDLNTIIHDDLTSCGQIEDTRVARAFYLLRFVWFEI